MRTGVHPLLTVDDDLVVIGPTHGDRRTPGRCGASSRRIFTIPLDPPRQEHHNADNL